MSELIEEMMQTFNEKESTVKSLENSMGNMKKMVISYKDILESYYFNIIFILL